MIVYKKILVQKNHLIFGVSCIYFILYVHFLLLKFIWSFKKKKNFLVVCFNNWSFKSCFPNLNRFHFTILYKSENLCMEFRNTMHISYVVRIFSILSIHMIIFSRLFCRVLVLKVLFKMFSYLKTLYIKISYHLWRLARRILKISVHIDYLRFFLSRKI